MNRIPVVLLASLLSACASSGKSEGQKQVAELTKRINELAAEIEKGKPEIESTIAEHDAIVNVADGDLIGHYRKFARGIERVEAQRERVRKAVYAVRAAATPYYDHWRAETSRIEDDELRKTAQQRLMESRDRYTEVFHLGDQARESYEPLMARLRDHQIFWANDLNADSAVALKMDAEKVAAEAQKLYGLMDEVVTAARRYNETASMRAEPLPTAGPAPE